MVELGVAVIAVIAFHLLGLISCKNYV